MAGGCARLPLNPHPRSLTCSLPCPGSEGTPCVRRSAALCTRKGSPAQLPWHLGAISDPSHTGHGANQLVPRLQLAGWAWTLGSRAQCQWGPLPSPRCLESLDLLPVSKQISLQLSLCHDGPNREARGGEGEPGSANVSEGEPRARPGDTRPSSARGTPDPVPSWPRCSHLPRGVSREQGCPLE